MKAYLNPAATDELVRRASEHAHKERPRAEGLHVSNLVQCRRKSWYVRKLQEGGAGEPEHDIDTLIMFMIGQGHHVFLQRGADERTLTWCPPELDGVCITGNVDAHEHDVDGPVELKTTRYSAKKNVWEMQQYIEQDASYAVMEGEEEGRLITEARIHVFHLLGDYTGAKKSSAAAWDIEFTPEEIRNWREEMIRRAKVILGDEVPSLDEHRNWECDYCPFLQSRGGPCPGSKGSKRVWFVAENELEELRNVRV